MKRILFAFALLMATVPAATAAIDRKGSLDAYLGEPRTFDQRVAAFKLVEMKATRCIARAVFMSAAYDSMIDSFALNRLITDIAVPDCRTYLLRLIETYDGAYDRGGEDYFLGKYLDKLPTVIQQLRHD